MKKSLGCITIGLLAAVVVMPSHPASAKGAGGPLPDGHWAGTMSVGATIDFSQGGTGLITSGKGDGTFDLDLAGGTASGTYTLGASSDATEEGNGVTGDVSAAGAISGTLEGTSTGPILQPAGAHFDVTGSVTVNGYTVPVNQGHDFGPDDLISSTLVITSSSCTVASGTWAQEFKSAIQAGGGNVGMFQGSWAASYTGSGDAATASALQDLEDRGEAILTSWLANGTFDAEALESVLVDAEHFAVSGPKNDACHAATKGQWASPLAGLVQRLLGALANSSSTTAEDLRFGIAAGLRTGNLPSVDDPIEGQLQTKASSLLDAAIASGSKTEIELIAISADSLGWDDLTDRAATALAAL
ncbi:MAG: hypothetical protein JWM34_4313 [Ilumatobacteraceae bacterium]|nr:hypothetical protein [Ilumatobacteraceae bacterium]